MDAATLLRTVLPLPALVTVTVVGVETIVLMVTSYCWFAGVKTYRIQSELAATCLVSPGSGARRTPARNP